jgi:hypothetical protein
MNFAAWLNVFVQKKGLDQEHLFEVEGPTATNLIELGVVLETLREQSPAHEQQAVKDVLVRLDFRNQPVLPYFEHLAKALAL